MSRDIPGAGVELAYREGQRNKRAALMLAKRRDLLEQRADRIDRAGQVRKLRAA